MRDGHDRGRLFAAGLVLACVASLSACSGGGFGGLFESSKPAAAVAGTTMASSSDTPTTGDPSGKTHPTGNSSIAVLVNEDPITHYDIEQRMRLMRLGGGKTSEKAATDELIDETLQLYEARKRGVNVPQAQVDGAFASIAQNLKMSPTQLTGALSSQGVEAASLKKRLRAQITWQALVQRRTQQKAQVKSEDVTSALLAKGDPNQLKMTEFTLQQIVFVVPKDSPAAMYSQRRREAEAFRQRFQGCDQSLAQAKELKGVVVKDIGRRDSTQLGGAEGDAIKKTPAGKTAPPSQFDQGIEVIAVCATRDVQSTAAARAEITNDFYIKQSKDLGKDYMQELRTASIIEYR